MIAHPALLFASLGFLLAVMVFAAFAWFNERCERYLRIQAARARAARRCRPARFLTPLVRRSPLVLRLS